LIDPLKVVGDCGNPFAVVVCKTASSLREIAVLVYWYVNYMSSLLNFVYILGVVDVREHELCHSIIIYIKQIVKLFCRS